MLGGISANEAGHERLQPLAFSATGRSRNQNVTGVRVAKVRQNWIAFDSYPDRKGHRAPARIHKPAVERLEQQNRFSISSGQVNDDESSPRPDQRRRFQRQGNLQVLGTVDQRSNLHASGGPDFDACDLGPLHNISRLYRKAKCLECSNDLLPNRDLLAIPRLCGRCRWSSRPGVTASRPSNSTWRDFRRLASLRISDWS